MFHRPPSLRNHRIGIRARDGIAIATTVLAVIGTVRGRPSLVVLRAVETLRDTVLGEYVGVEEVLVKEMGCQLNVHHTHTK